MTASYQTSAEVMTILVASWNLSKAIRCVQQSDVSGNQAASTSAAWLQRESYALRGFCLKMLLVAALACRHGISTQGAAAGFYGACFFSCPASFQRWVKTGRASLVTGTTW